MGAQSSCSVHIQYIQSPGVAHGSVVTSHVSHAKSAAANLSTAAWRLMTMRVMHSVAMKFSAMFRWMFAASGEATMVALAIVEMMIDVSVEVIRPVKPGSRTNEHTAYKPLRPIIPVGGAVVRRNFIVPVRTDRRRSDADRNLRLRVIPVGQNHADTNRQKTEAL
jgi:hypothetical protein